MKGEIHGINCNCCENKSPEAKAILKEIDKILLESKGSGLTAKEETIKKMKEVATLFNKSVSASDYSKFPGIPPDQKFPGKVGSIDVLVKLVEKVFSLPDGDINYDILKLDPNKKIKGKKVSDISENIKLDISQIIDFSGIDLNKFKKLKISLVPPTIVATIELKFGPIGIGIEFRIGLKSISWNPSFKFDNPEDALKNLKGTTYKKLITESGNKKLDELQKLAKKQFSDNQPVLKSLNTAKNERDFFGLLNMQGVNLFEDVDVEKEARAFYENAVKVKELTESSVLPEPEETLPSDIGKIELCPTKQPSPAPYRKEEIEKVHNSVCSPESLSGETTIDTEIKLPDFDLPTQESETKKIQDFVSEVDGYTKAMQECADKKVKATNRWWAFYELDLLNDVSLAYFVSLRNAYESLNGSLQTILRRRDYIVNEIALVNSQRISLFEKYNQFYRQVFPTSTVQFNAFEIPGTAIRVNLDEYSSNPLGGSTSLTSIVGTTQSLSPIDEASLTAVQRIQQTSILSDLSVLNTKRLQLLSDLNAVQTDYNQFKNSVFLGIDQNSSIENIRKNLSSHTNSITNLVGYKYTWGLIEPTNTDYWTVQVAPTIYEKTLTLWNQAKNSPADQIGGNIGGIASPLSNYIIPLELPDYAESVLRRDRLGVFETGVWKPFYSAKRIDYFYTYAEQGYNQPKPEYNDKGEVIGAKINKKIVNGQNQETIVQVPQNADGLKVDPDIATAFLDTLETTIKNKVNNKVQEIKNGQTYKNYVNNTIYTAAQNEAKKVFYENISSKSYLDGARSLFAISSLRDYQRKAYVIGLFKSNIINEMTNILKEIEGHDKCVETNKKAIEDAAKKLGGNSAGSDSENLKEKCKKLLGSDPVGNKPPGGTCPTFLKNCYWKEYTKILQLVSLMPIPELDPQNLAMRLFRYYPVAIQIPVPSPVPVVLPTLALGIPDPLISIPLPLLWKHIVTVNTPLGTIVTWLAMAGPIPSPFIMLIDEKGEATFMVTSRGPCSIPHPTVGGLNPLEEKSLLDILLPPGTVKINLGSPLGKLLVGNINNDIDNPDSSKNVIDKLKEKIKTSFDQLEIPDPPSILGNSEIAKKRKKQIKKAFEKIPPDATVIEEAIKEVFKLVEDAIDKIKISDIKIPKDDKGMMVPILGPLEVLDNLLKMIDTAASAPGEIADQVLKDLGMAIKTINLTKELKEKILQEVSTVEIKEFFKELDAEIAELEAALSFDVDLLPEEKIEKRVEIIKKAIKKPLEKAAEKISPEALGFIAKALDVPPLPFPCYSSIQLPPVPPYIYVIIAAFKAAPAIIDSIDAKTIANLVSFELNLENQLPNAEQLFYNTINGVLDTIPFLEVPSGLNDNMFKQTIDMIKQIPQKFKVRLPKPGLPVQLIIPGALIKTIMKEAAKLALTALISLIIAKVTEAIAEKNYQKIIAVALIIKALFGSDLSEIKGSDVKAFIGGLLDANVYPTLDAVSSIIEAANALKSDFLSIIELFQFPPKPSLPGNDGPFYEVGTEMLKPILEPLLNAVLPLLFENMPMPVVLLACSSTPARLAFTKLHPTKPFDRVPSWESLSSKNVPFLIWLDYLVATAQRKSGLGSTYLVSAGGYQAIP